MSLPSTPVGVLVMVIGKGINVPTGSDGKAPRQGCSVFSPSVEEGRKPRRRPRGRSVGKNPLDPARGRTIKPTRGVRHPGGVVYLLCIFVSRGRRSYAPPTPGLKDDDPSGATPLRDRVAPLVGAHSIDIGHPRSGDRCTAPHPSDPSHQSDPSDKTAPSFDERFY